MNIRTGKGFINHPAESKTAPPRNNHQVFILFPLSIYHNNNFTFYFLALEVCQYI